MPSTSIDRRTRPRSLPMGNSIDLPAQLPQSISGALRLLEDLLLDLGNILPGELLDHYVAVKRTESAQMAELNQDEANRLMVTFF